MKMNRIINQKFRTVMSFAFVVSLCLSCDMFEGPMGPTGEKGEDGQPGNANVKVYTFDGHDFESQRVFHVDIPMTRAEFDNKLFYTYMRSTSAWYLLPNYGLSAQTYYRTYHQYVSARNAVQVSISRVAESGDGETYEVIKVVTIDKTPTSSSQNHIQSTLERGDFSQAMKELNIEE